MARRKESDPPGFGTRWRWWSRRFFYRPAGIRQSTVTGCRCRADRSADDKLGGGERLLQVPASPAHRHRPAHDAADYRLRRKVEVRNWLTASQSTYMALDPEMIRCLAKRISTNLAPGEVLEVHAVVSLNGRPSQPMVRLTADSGGTFDASADYVVLFK